MTSSPGAKTSFRICLSVVSVMPRALVLCCAVLSYLSRLVSLSMFYERSFCFILFSSCFFSCFLSVHTSLANQIKLDLVRRNVSLCSNHGCPARNRAALIVPDFEDQSCFCDNECLSYNDCCFNSSVLQLDPRPPAPSTPISDASPQCRVMRHYQGVYVVSQCPSNYKGSPTVLELCHQSQHLLERPLFGGDTGDQNDSRDGVGAEDPFLTMPVTSRSRRLTYNNLYCALCHGLSVDEVDIWPSRLECPHAPVSAKKQVARFFESQQLSNELDRSEDDPANVTLRREEPGNRWFLYYNKDRYACSIDPYFPDTLMTFIRRCRSVVTTCPVGYNGDRLALELCPLYAAYVYDYSDSAYQNPHCAICNGLLPEEQECYQVSIRSRWRKTQGFEVAAFSLILDFSGSGSVGELKVKHNCSLTQFWDPYIQMCRDLTCDESAGYELVNRRCEIVKIMDVSVNDTSGDTSDDGTNNDFLSCPKIVLDSDLFVTMDNETVAIPLYDGLVLYRGEYNLVNLSDNTSDSGQKIEICSPDFARKSKFGAVLGYLSIICLLISIVSLSAHLSAFCALSELRNLSGRNLASLSVCLLAFYIGFLASPAVLGRPSSCRILAVCNYVLYLAAFCWMNVMSFDVYYTLRMASRQLRLMSEDGRGRYLLYLTYVTLVVLLLTTLTVLADLGELPGLPEQLVPRFGQDLSVCWFGNRPALLVFVAVPVLLILLANVVLFIATVSIIRETRSSTVSHSCSASVMNFRLYWRLSLMMGLSWLLSLLNGWLDIDYLHYITTIINALQGFFIFVSFTLNDKVRAKLMARLRRYNAVVSWSRDTTLKTGRPTSSSNTNTNTTSMASVSSTPGGRTSAKARDGVRDQSLVIECSHVDGDDGDDGVSGTTRL